MCVLPFLLLLVAVPLASAQTDTEEAAVLATVDALFDAMRAADSTALRATLHPQATLYRVGTNQAGEFGLHRTPIDAFVRAVGTPHPEVYDERLGEAEVRIDDALATVWVPYAFYLGDTFSHCGTNAFHLARLDDRWRVIHTTDTQRTDDCNPSIR